MSRRGQRRDIGQELKYLPFLKLRHWVTQIPCVQYKPDVHVTLPLFGPHLSPICK
jgi:hypothetical protein